jgi:hypothetical protein
MRQTPAVKLCDADHHPQQQLVIHIFESPHRNKSPVDSPAAFASAKKKYRVNFSARQCAAED